MLQGEHSAILSTFIKLPFVILMIFVLSIFEWPLNTGFTVALWGYKKKSLIVLCHHDNIPEFKKWQLPKRVVFHKFSKTCSLTSTLSLITNRGSYTRAHVLLNLLNELRKKIKCEAC